MYSIEIIKRYFFITYAISLLKGTLEEKSGIILKETHLVHNVTQLVREYRQHNVRQKRQIFDIENELKLRPKLNLFVRRHIRRGVCKFVLENVGTERFNNYNNELRYLASNWAAFTNNGNRNLHSFIIHRNLDYYGILDILYNAVTRYEWIPYNNMRLVNIPPEELARENLQVVQLYGIRWRINIQFEKWEIPYNAHCVCGNVGIILGLEIRNNDFDIIHFHGISGDMQNDVLCI